MRLLRLLGLTLTLALAAATLGACATGGATGADDDDGELYEDVPDPGKADGNTLVAQHAIAGYTPSFTPYVVTGALPVLVGEAAAPGRKLVAIRQLTYDRQAALVLVDAESLAVMVARTSDVVVAARAAQEGELAATPYVTGLAESRDHALDRLAPGARDAGHTQARFVVTVDMCQSSRLWERRFFQGLVDLGHAIGEPVPVGIAMTGRWARVHATEFAQLLTWARNGDLRITWIDHSYDHQLSLSNGIYHFLADPSIDMTAEVTKLEVLLLGQGQVFSPFFRFPGLTYNATRLAQVNALSLFALDGNAWLAKGQPVADGAVVLLHGNGNEHAGIQIWNEELAAWRSRLVDGTAAIVPVAGVAAQAP